jgi:hypothetical protein
MVTTMRSVWTVLFLVVTFAVLGCASSGVSKAIGPNDMPSLAGKWSGNMSLPSGQTAYGTMEMSPNGDYSVQASGFSAQGKATIRDGNLVLVPTASSGAIDARGGQRTSTASLTERADGLVLKGFGHSAAGPFNFEVSKAK